MQYVMLNVSEYMYDPQNIHGVFTQSLNKGFGAAKYGSRVNDRSEIWQASRQHCWRDARQISERHNNFDI